MKCIRPLILQAFLCIVPLTFLRAQTADKLKIKVRQVTEQGFTEKRVPVQVIPVSDRTLMTMIAVPGEELVRDHKKSMPRFELYDRAKVTLLRGQDPVAHVKAGDLFVDQLVHFRGDAIMLAVRRDTVRGVVELYWQKLDPNLTKNHPYFTLLSTFDTRTFGDGTLVPAGSGYHDRFHTSISPNGDYLLVYSKGVIDADGDMHRPMIVVGEHMQEVWKHTLRVEDDAPLATAQLDNAGVAHLLEQVRVKPEDKRDTTRFGIKLTRVDEQGRSEPASGLNKGHWIKSAVFRPLADGQILCAGIHGGLNPKGEPVLGEFTGRIVPGGAGMEGVKQHTFDLDRDDALITRNGVRLADVQPTSDGGVYLIREYHLQTDAVDAKTSMSGLRWIHGPVVVTRRDPAGEELWSTTFRRAYYSPDKLAGDVMATTYKDDLLLFLLDSDVMAEKRKRDDKKLLHTDQKSPYSAYVHFTSDGTFRSKGVLNGSDGTFYLMGDRLYTLTPTDHIMLSAPKANGRSTALARIELGE